MFAPCAACLGWHGAGACRPAECGRGETTCEQDKWLTLVKGATRLQLTEDTIRRWCQSGKLQATLLSRRAGYRIPASEIDRLLIASRPMQIEGSVEDASPPHR